MVCISCARFLHGECEKDPCCCKAKETEATGQSLTVTNPTEKAEVTRGRQHKEIEDIQNPKSTGRKRAAVFYPLDKSAPCEWRMKKNCGGGKRPIVGCLNGLQVNRHHGPDKNTLNNAPDNVHRICADCHNRWHYLNDGDYDDTVKLNLHDSENADVMDITLNEIKWVDGSFDEIVQMRVERFGMKGTESD